jgi:hypothetical protein
MTRLTRPTLDRLKQLPRVASVWEGDRRTVNGFLDDDLPLQPRGEESSDCIIWVDSQQEAVRGWALVPSESGYEPIVRTLLQAIEHPQSSLPPARPQRIVVRDREIQFYLRGALQGLDIAIDYAPELPLIDRMFEAMQDSSDFATVSLPLRYQEAMVEKAMDMWELSPWNSLNEQQILAIDINQWDVDTLYVSMLGMGGVEYGLLLYRSLESLKQFRDRVLTGQQSTKQMREAFLEQDCLFLNFQFFDEPVSPVSPPPGRWLSPAPDAVTPEFGSIHPLEGLRNQLADEEGAVLLVAMEAIQRFFAKYRSQLEKALFPALQGKYRIANPENPQENRYVSVTVKTLPTIAEELMQQAEDLWEGPADGMADMPILRDDYVPEGALIVLRPCKRDWLATLSNHASIHCQTDGELFVAGAADLPTVLIQTSKPKAKTLVQHLRQAEGVQGVCFNPGNDPFNSHAFQLGLLQTGDGELHLFAEYDTDSPPDRHILKLWEDWQEKSAGTCCVIVAGGVSGKAKGNPQAKDILGVFQARCCTPEALQLSPLLLQYVADWDAD